MSKGWESGSSRAWRKLRSDRLFTDGGLCQLRTQPDCEVYADQVHHLDGVANGKIVPLDRLLSACGPCNRAAGDPTATDPPPNPPATQWD